MREGRPRSSLPGCYVLRSGVGERASEDVRVSERGRASLFGSGFGWYGGAVLDGGLRGGSPGVDRRAVGRVAGVVPDAGAVRAGGDCVHVVTEELEPEV